MSKPAPQPKRRGRPWPADHQSVAAVPLTVRVSKEHKARWMAQVPVKARRRHVEAMIDAVTK